MLFGVLSCEWDDIMFILSGMLVTLRQFKDDGILPDPTS